MNCPANYSKIVNEATHNSLQQLKVHASTYVKRKNKKSF